MFKIKNLTIFIFILSIGVLYSQEAEQISNSNTLVEKMDNYTAEKEKKWSYNPFRSTEIERRMVGWQDPNANITRFWVGNIFNAKSIYSNPNFFVDEVMLFMTPTLATEFTVIPLKTGRFKFNIGVAFLIDINMIVYSERRQRHGANLIMSDNMKVEGYIDMIIDDTWKIRFLPIIHRCDHIAGDWYGDPALYNAYEDEYCDTGYENMGIQAFKIFGWFTFYGGLEGSFNYLIPAIPSTFATMFSAHVGTDIRVPIWGKMNFIAGFYLAADYREYNEKYKEIDPETQISGEEVITKTYHKWAPVFSIGAGIEIDRYSLGIKYIRRPSQQSHSHREIEEKIGAEATFIF